jgi:vacuolar-type H+-ATPase subunit E/Vma4
MMEKVWGELRKIESQAEHIRNEAKDEAKKIKVLAQQEAEKLIVDSKAYAEEEGRKLYASAIQEANRNHDERLRANQESVEKLKVQAERRIDQASSTVANAVLGETVY